MAHVIKASFNAKGWLILIIFNLFIVFSSCAQSSLQLDRPLTAPRANEFGFKGGLNFAFFDPEAAQRSQTFIGFNAGVYARLPIYETLYFQPELLYSSRGARLLFDAGPFLGNNRLLMHYVDLPLLLAVDLGDYLRIQAGGYGSYLFGVNFTSDGQLPLDRSNFNPFDAGLSAGAVLVFPPMKVGIRYNHGLLPVARDGGGREFAGNVRHSFINVFVAIGF